MIEGKVKCESCGILKYEEEMSKSYKKRCKTCVAKQTASKRQECSVQVTNTPVNDLDVEAAAKKRYPIPSNGNTFDKEDFEFRKLLAQYRQKAYVTGITDYLNGKI